MKSQTNTATIPACPPAAAAAAGNPPTYEPKPFQVATTLHHIEPTTNVPTKYSPAFDDKRLNEWKKN